MTLLPLRRLSAALTGGAVGGLANSLAVWLAVSSGFAAALGVSLAPEFSPQWLYPRVVWGGLWGLLFLLPLRPPSVVSRGLLLGLAPSLVQLLVVFPLKTTAGIFGLGLGTWTPLLVLLFNAVWGLTAALWYEKAR